MLINKSFNFGSSYKKNCQFTLPDECPHCFKALAPQVLSSIEYRDNSDTYYVTFALLCNNCYNSFIAQFITTEERQQYLSQLIFYGPKSHQQEAFSDEIQEISPNFVKIYNQACAAESNNLDEIAGLGFRKALEFLIKDYLCMDKPENEQETILKKFLGNVIREDIGNQNLKNVAQRAVWLGNDEAHYYRKWENKDISDLKLLVKLSVNWIENEILTKKYIEDMPHGQN